MLFTLALSWHSRQGFSPPSIGVSSTGDPDCAKLILLKNSMNKMGVFCINLIFSLCLPFLMIPGKYLINIVITTVLLLVDFLNQVRQGMGNTAMTTHAGYIILCSCVMKARSFGGLYSQGCIILLVTINTSQLIESGMNIMTV
jgi:hypothetical protein